MNNCNHICSTAYNQHHPLPHAASARPLLPPSMSPTTSLKQRASRANPALAGRWVVGAWPTGAPTPARVGGGGPVPADWSPPTKRNSRPARAMLALRPRRGPAGADGGRHLAVGAGRGLVAAPPGPSQPRGPHQCTDCGQMPANVAVRGGAGGRALRLVGCGHGRHGRHPKAEWAGGRRACHRPPHPRWAVTAGRGTAQAAPRPPARARVVWVRVRVRVALGP